MSDDTNDLLLAALKRAGRPQTSASLLDSAVGLALAEGWDNDHVSRLSAKAVARRMQVLEDRGLVRSCAPAIDARNRRTTPQFEPVQGWDAAAPIPSPPSAGRAAPRAQEQAPDSAYRNHSREQLLVVLDVHDMLADCVQRFMADLSSTREKARKRLLAAGLEVS